MNDGIIEIGKRIRPVPNMLSFRTTKHPSNRSLLEVKYLREGKREDIQFTRKDGAETDIPSDQLEWIIGCLEQMKEARDQNKKEVNRNKTVNVLEGKNI